MPSGYKPKVPLQRLNYPWLEEQSGYTPPASIGTTNSVVLPPGMKKSNRFAYSAPPTLDGISRVPTIKLDNLGKKPIDWKGIASNIQSTAQTLAPFASNIVNAFRKPPKPAVPKLNSYTNLSKINLDDERNRIGRATEAANVSADRNVPSNTAAAIRASNLGTKLNALSSVSERESNANAGIGNQQAQMDMQTNFYNNRSTDQYNDSMVERNVAQQREQSQNVSNAADKYVSIQNEKNKAQVDLSKTQMLSHIFDNSGVLSRVRAKAKAAGEPDPLGRNYEDLTGTNTGKPIFKMGGRIPMKKIS